MKTLRLTLTDLELGPLGDTHRVTGEAWARYTREVRTTAGALVVLAQSRKTVPATGVVEWSVLPNDDPTVHPDDAGFGIEVGWDLYLVKAAPPGRSSLNPDRLQVIGGKTITVTSADPAVVSYASKAPATPADPLVSYATESEVAGMIDAATGELITGAQPLPYVPAVTLALPNPAYIAHRGGAGIAPEETMDAFRVSVAGGADGLEMDLQPLADGALALMHDPTVDRTTNGTGNVSSYTAPAWQALNAAAKFPWNGKVVAPALLPQVLGEFGGQVALFIEPKDQANAVQLMDACDKKQLRANVVVEISDPAVLPVVKARGYKCYFWWGAESGATTAAINTAVANGADYLGPSSAFADATIAAMVATGVPVMPYTVNRRVDKARLLALGVKGFLTDQPVYLKATTAQRTVDSWRQGVFGHGMLAASVQNVSLVGTAIQIAAPIASALTPGEVCPIASAAGSYTIDLDVAFVTLPADTTRAISVSVCIADDGLYSHDGGPASFPNEYRCYLRANGQMSLYRVVAGNGGTFTQLGTTVATAALTAGGFAHLRITVTPTNITMARTDSAGTIGPVADSTYRGGYVTLSKNSTDSAVQFKNLVVT